MSQRNVTEPQKSIPIYAEVDVLVVGGGPSGVAAAVAASRAGARTLLVERHGFLGGMWTAGLVLTLAGYNCWLKPYYRCVDGIGGEWLRHATSKGLAEDNLGWVVNSDPEGMKLVADALLEEAGVDILFHTWVADPIVHEKRIEGAFIENVEGRRAILSKVTIDATGNGDMIYRASDDWEKGETLQPMTLAFDLGNVKPDPKVSHTEPRELPIGPKAIELTGDTLRGNASRRLDVAIDYAQIENDRESKDLPLFGGPWFGGLWKDVVWMNTVRIVGDGSNATDLTRAEIQGRKDAFKLTEYFRGAIPGFSDARIQRMGPQIGVRETRRLVGEYTLSAADVRNEATFDDAIGLGCWSIDIHPNTAKANHSMYVPLPYQIPYRCLVPRSAEGLLAAGRCISVDREALASIRVGATCTVTGHAAGIAAALAVRSKTPPRSIDISELQQTLRKQNALIDLPQKVSN
jgi:hypothetical protein